MCSYSKEAFEETELQLVLELRREGTEQNCYITVL